MKYKVTLYGLGGELHIGTIAEATYNYFKASGNLQDYITGETEVPEDVMLDIPVDRIRDIDDIAHCFGAFYSEGTFVSVSREEDNVPVFESEFDDAEEIMGFCDDLVNLNSVEEDYVLMGVDIQKGVFNEYLIDTEELFDPELLEVQFNRYTDNTAGGDIFIITGMLYDGVELQPTDEHATTGKAASLTLYDVKNQESITT